MVRNLFRAVVDIMYIGLFFILFSEKSKRIGDIVAGTVVVAEYYENVPLRSKNPPASRRAGLEQLSHLKLSTEEQDLLHMYLARKMYLPDNGENLKNQWAEYFSQKWQIESSIIDDALLAALLQLNEGEY